ARRSRAVACPQETVPWTRAAGVGGGLPRHHPASHRDGALSACRVEAARLRSRDARVYWLPATGYWLLVQLAGAPDACTYLKRISVTRFWSESSSWWSRLPFVFSCSMASRSIT